MNSWFIGLNPSTHSCFFEYIFVLQSSFDLLKTVKENIVRNSDALSSKVVSSRLNIIHIAVPVAGSLFFFHFSCFRTLALVKQYRVYVNESIRCGSLIAGDYGLAEFKQ